MIRMTSENVTTVKPVTIIDVYKLRDEKSDKNFLSAHNEGLKKLT
jgi:hypothetical protein